MAIFPTATAEPSSYILFSTAAEHQNMPTQPLDLSRSAGTASIAEPHLALPLSHSIGGPHGTCRFVNRKMPQQFLSGKQGKQGTLQTFMLQAPEILSSREPQCTQRRSTPGQVPEEVPCFPGGGITVTRTHTRETEALISVT